MCRINGIFQRLSGQPLTERQSDCDERLLRRLHLQLVDALAFRDAEALANLLAPDAELRSGRKAVGGRERVISALAEQASGQRLHVGVTEVTLRGEMAVIDAIWHLETDNDLDSAFLRSCIFAMRRGYWRLVSLRDLPLRQRPQLARVGMGV